MDFNSVLGLVAALIAAAAAFLSFLQALSARKSAENSGHQVTQAQIQAEAALRQAVAAEKQVADMHAQAEAVRNRESNAFMSQLLPVYEQFLNDWARSGPAQGDQTERYRILRTRLDAAKVQVDKFLAQGRHAVTPGPSRKLVDEYAQEIDRFARAMTKDIMNNSGSTIMEIVEDHTKRMAKIKGQIRLFLDIHDFYETADHNEGNTKNWSPPYGPEGGWPE